MQVSVENISKIERRLTITVPSAQVEEAYERCIADFAKKANIKGFRPGKVPQSYIKQHYGESARREALGEVMQKALYEAIGEQKLQPISQPKVDPKMSKEGEPFEFTASFEVLPEIDKVSFEKDSIEKAVVDVKDEDVDRVINQLRKQYTKWNKVEREAKNTDRVVLDYYAIFDDKEDEDNKVSSYPLELGGNTMIPGFEEGLVGAKAGEERKLSLTFPEDYADKEKAGKPIEFVVTVQHVYEAEMPELDEEFIKQLGVKSGQLDEIKTQIKQSLTQERDRLVKEKLKEQVFQALLDQNPLDLPQSLVNNEAKNIHDEMYPQHKNQADHQHSAEETAAFQDVAKKRVALGLLIAEYAKQQEIKPDEARVKLRIKEIAASYEKPEEVEAWLSTKERIGGIEAQVIEDQVLDNLIESVTIKEKTMSYADLKGIRV